MGVITSVKPRELGLCPHHSSSSPQTIWRPLEITPWGENSILPLANCGRGHLEGQNEATDLRASSPLHVQVVTAQAPVPATTPCNTGTPVPRNSLQEKASSRQSRKKRTVGQKERPPGRGPLKSYSHFLYAKKLGEKGGG